MCLSNAIRTFSDATHVVVVATAAAAAVVVVVVVDDVVTLLLISEVLVRLVPIPVVDLFPQPVSTVPHSPSLFPSHSRQISLHAILPSQYWSSSFPSTFHSKAHPLSSSTVPRPFCPAHFNRLSDSFTCACIKHICQRISCKP